MALAIGSRYTREEVRAKVGGGDLQSYLPHANGNVLCGCFNPTVNKRAPIEIDLGAGRDVIRYARLLLEQDCFVPVFLKRDTSAWEYVGRFRAVEYVTDKSELFPAKSFRRPDAIAVLILETEPGTSDFEITHEPGIPLAAALEGGAALVNHLRRERSRPLSDAKRRSHLAEYGQLSCQACGLSSFTLPRDIGNACFEVHHMIPIGQREAAVITKLDDLALLCANCHRLIHRSSPMLSIGELTQLLTRAEFPALSKACQK